MERHAYFDLWLHDDAELASIIGNPVMERATIHEWPLSCVQRIRCASGASYVYKTQAPPTVEPAFYQRAHSPLLVTAQVLQRDHGLDALLLEDIQATRLDALNLDDASRRKVVDDIIAQIAQIDGDLPALSDIQTPALWLEHGQAITKDLHALVEQDSFQIVTQAMVEQFIEQVYSPAVMSAILGSTGYVHMDLWAENVLMLECGYRVLDWQRPIWGPIALDRVTLSESVGLVPSHDEFAGVLQLRALLSIGWFAQAARYWFPPGAPTYDREIAKLISQMKTQQS